MNRDEIVAMLEGYWRSVFVAQRAGGTDAVQQVTAHLDQRIAAAAAALPPDEAAVFARTVEAERDRMRAAYDADRYAFEMHLLATAGQRAAPASDALQPAQIATGRWQLWAGSAIEAFGVFALLAATPFNGAGAVADVCLSVGSALLFWSLILRCFSVIEAKIDRLLHGPPSP